MSWDKRTVNIEKEEKLYLDEKDKLRMVIVSILTLSFSAKSQGQEAEGSCSSFIVFSVFQMIQGSEI